MSKKGIFGKPLDYSKHARDRMRELGISEEEVEKIRDFGSIVSSVKNKEVKRLGKKRKGIKAVFLKFKNTVKVKTVIREGMV